MIFFHEAVRHLLTDHEPSPHPDNPNMGDVDEIMASVLANGCYAPIWVSRTSGRIVKGHHLYLALRELGATSWPVLWLEDLTPEAELRILLADNKIARLARLEPRDEVQALLRLSETPVGLAGTGYTDRELASMLEALEREDSVPLDLDGPSLPRETTCPCCGRRMEE